jgi:hypothetical protein
MQYNALYFLGKHRRFGGYIWSSPSRPKNKFTPFLILLSSLMYFYPENGIVIPSEKLIKYKPLLMQWKRLSFNSLDGVISKKIHVYNKLQPDIAHHKECSSFEHFPTKVKKRHSLPLKFMLHVQTILLSFIPFFSNRT